MRFADGTRPALPRKGEKIINPRELYSVIDELETQKDEKYGEEDSPNWLEMLNNQ